MSLERILNTLMNMGLTEQEAEIYVFLAKNGPKREIEIANQLNAAKEYQLSYNLIRLKKKGFVSIVVNEEKVFFAISFQTVLDNLIKSNLEEADRVAKEKESMFR